MKNEQQKSKKGFFGMLRESFGKTGGCCGGSGCCEPSEESDKAQTKETEKAKDGAQAAQK